jgi:hypothetical protein
MLRAVAALDLLRHQMVKARTVFRFIGALTLTAMRMLLIVTAMIVLLSWLASRFA